jgi:hypothetical protein
MAAISDDRHRKCSGRPQIQAQADRFTTNTDTIVGAQFACVSSDPHANLEDAMEFPRSCETMNLLQLLKSLERQQRSMAIVLTNSEARPEW